MEITFLRSTVLPAHPVRLVGSLNSIPPMCAPCVAPAHSPTAALALRSVKVALPARTWTRTPSPLAFPAPLGPYPPPLPLCVSRVDRAPLRRSISVYRVLRASLLLTASRAEIAWRVAMLTAQVLPRAPQPLRGRSPFCREARLRFHATSDPIRYVM